MKIKIISAVVILALFPYSANAKNKMKESRYQEIDCSKRKGKVESIIKGGRIDCETEYFAIEYDFAKKWAECLGQALFYSAYTSKVGLCILIVENNKDFKYIKKLEKAIEYHGLHIGVDVIKNLN